AIFDPRRHEKIRRLVMRNTARSLLTGSIIAAAAACTIVVPARAQSTAASIGGHWKGTLQIQQMQIEFDVDIAKGVRGDLEGTIGLPSQHIKGLPLLKVAVDGNVVSFYA